MPSLKTQYHNIYKGYTKKKKIGEGTYAVVYTGSTIPKDESIKPMKIAIKKIKPGLFQDGLDMSAIREIKYLKAIKHPNVIELIDVVTRQEQLHLILEYLDADLEMIIKNTRVVFGNADIKSWMLMLLRGLFSIHQNFILHRDLKPNNLLLSDKGILKIADFGLARMYGETSMNMTCQVVTRWYRAPELLLGAKIYGPQVDIWSVGCIFAELMLRTPYFSSETDIGQLKTIMRARGTPTEQDWPGMKLLPDCFEFQQFPPTPLRTIFTAAGNDALDLLDAMLQYDPLKRPTCETILQHSYFTNVPRPTKPHKLPRDVPAPKRKLDHEEEQGGKKTILNYRWILVISYGLSFTISLIYFFILF